MGHENRFVSQRRIGLGNHVYEAPKEVDTWLKENGLEGKDLTTEGLRENWKTLILAIAQCPDRILTNIYGADEAGIEKYRTYYSTVFCAETPPGNAPA